MTNFKIIIPAAFMVLLLSFPGSYALTMKKAVRVEKGKNVVSNSVKNVAPGHSKRVRKIAGRIKRIEGGILYMGNDARYDLRGAKVIDYTKKTVSKKGKTAELLFINDDLKEVIIR